MEDNNILAKAGKVERAVRETCYNVRGEYPEDGNMYIAMKPNLTTSIARSVSLTILHDEYGISYKLLSAYCGMTEKSVMKRVAKVRTHRFMDAEYSQIYNKTLEIL